jgi:hypothetical protein
MCELEKVAVPGPTDPVPTEQSRTTTGPADGTTVTALHEQWTVGFTSGANALEKRWEMKDLGTEQTTRQLSAALWSETNPLSSGFDKVIEGRSHPALSLVQFEEPGSSTGEGEYDGSLCVRLVEWESAGWKGRVVNTSKGRLVGQDAPQHREENRIFKGRGQKGRPLLIVPNTGLRLEKLSAGRKNAWPLVPDIVQRIADMWDLSVGNVNVSVTEEMGELRTCCYCEDAEALGVHAVLKCAVCFLQFHESCGEQLQVAVRQLPSPGLPGGLVPVAVGDAANADASGPNTKAAKATAKGKAKGTGRVGKGK